MSKIYNSKELIKVIIQLEIKKLVKEKGLQATEDVIYRVYSVKTMYKCRDTFLKVLYESYPFYHFKNSNLVD